MGEWVGRCVSCGVDRVGSCGDDRPSVHANAMQSHASTQSTMYIQPTNARTGFVGAADLAVGGVRVAVAVVAAVVVAAYR